MLGDRTELRGVRNSRFKDLEAETRPFARLTLDWPRSNVMLGFTPIGVVAPLENSTRREKALRTTPDRQVLLMEAADAAAGTVFGSGRTTLALTQTVSFAERDFRRESLLGGQAQSGASPTGEPATGGPTTGEPTTGEPGTGTPAAPSGPGSTTGTSTPQAGRAVAEVVKFGSERTSAALAHGITPTQTLRFAVGFDVSGGLDEKARVLYPLILGPDVSVSLTSALGPRDLLTGSGTGSCDFSRVAEPVNGAEPRFVPRRTCTITGLEAIAHQFSPSLSGTLGAGVSYSKDGGRGIRSRGAAFPNGQLSFAYQRPLGGGNFATGLAAQAAPTVDATTARTDWRYSGTASLSWRFSRLSLASGATGTSSRKPSSISGTRSLGGFTTLAYDLGSGFALDGGGRAAWQEARGVQTVPATEVVFVALSYTNRIAF